MAGTTRVKVSGPLFDGRAEEAARRMCEDITAKTSAQAAAIIRSKAKRFNKSGRGKTGQAADHVKLRQVEMVATITGLSETGVTWWPWLEGVSKRNESTRFRGYHTFRMASAIARKQIRTTAKKLMASYLPEMGGE
jgi:hypothetical protein